MVEEEVVKEEERWGVGDGAGVGKVGEKEAVMETEGRRRGSGGGDGKGREKVGRRGW